MSKTYIIYKHTCPNGKVYIGQTCRTCSQRFGKLGLLYKHCPFFYHAILKYGWDNITHEIISTNLTSKEANWLENYLILYYQSYNKAYGYNLTLGGSGSVGRTLSEEGRLKLSLANLIRYSKEEEHLKSVLNNTQRKPVICLDTGEIYLSAGDASRLNHVHTNTVAKAIRLGRQVKGLTFKYIDNEE